MVVRGGGSRLGRPAALLQVFPLLPIRRNLLQDCQIRLRITALQEFLHADRRQGYYDGGISPFSREPFGRAAGHPAAPRKPDSHGCDGARSYSL